MLGKNLLNPGGNGVCHLPAVAQESSGLEEAPRDVMMGRLDTPGPPQGLADAFLGCGETVFGIWLFVVIWLLWTVPSPAPMCGQPGAQVCRWDSSDRRYGDLEASSPLTPVSPLSPGCLMSEFSQVCEGTM